MVIPDLMALRVHLSIKENIINRGSLLSVPGSLLGGMMTVIPHVENDG